MSHPFGFILALKFHTVHSFAKNLVYKYATIDLAIARLTAGLTLM